MFWPSNQLPLCNKKILRKNILLNLFGPPTLWSNGSILREWWCFEASIGKSPVTPSPQYWTPLHQGNLLSDGENAWLTNLMIASESKEFFAKLSHPTKISNIPHSHNMSPLIVSFFCKSRDDLAGNLRRWWFWWKALQLIGRYFHILPCGGSTANSGDVYCTFQQDLTISICSKKYFTTKYNFPICVCHLGEAIMQDCFSKKT